jgi:hypothetical protein
MWLVESCFLWFNRFNNPISCELWPPWRRRKSLFQAHLAKVHNMKEATVASMASEMGKIYNDIQNTCGLTCPNIARFPAMVKVWMVSICFFSQPIPACLKPWFVRQLVVFIAETIGTLKTRSWNFSRSALKNRWINGEASGSSWSGWWFQTFFIFRNIWDNPSHWLIFFRGVETTNQWFFCLCLLISNLH